jgi:hypothetical protein
VPLQVFLDSPGAAERGAWNTTPGLTIATCDEVTMAFTALTPATRVANQLLARKIVDRIKAWSPSGTMMFDDRWSYGAAEIALALDAAAACPHPQRRNGALQS